MDPAPLKETPMAASTRRWLRSVTTLAAVASAATLGLTVPAHAATPNPMAHPERDWMVSTIAAHAARGVAHARKV